MKDTSAGSHVACEAVGDGVIDWKGQLTALFKDALVDHITIETHTLPLMETSRKNVETLRRMLNEIESGDE